jgi:hypothetical protein
MPQHYNYTYRTFVSVPLLSKQRKQFLWLSPPEDTVLDQGHCVAFISEFVKLYSQSWLTICAARDEDFRKLICVARQHHTQVF